ncbi:MAG: hypothetical protein A3G41_08535 [Elusimicrobia bacterium RIFCSPLOWO2_12_FULL_59_9]|nr:MAG: hypothetical protein A3G41_08535 [Elusimicrobia bacterium RIFCSPLOWO2_12_FULL_59_9]
MIKALSARLYKERLAEFGRKISGETRLTPLLMLLAEEVRGMLRADRCTVFLADREKNILWSKIAQGLVGPRIRIPINSGVAGHVVETGRVVNIADAYKDGRFSKETDIITGYRTKTILAAPLRGRDGLILGVFQVLNKIRGRFNAEDEGLLQMISVIAATAVENAQLVEALRRSHLETIYRMAMVAEYRDQYDTAKHLRHISKYSAIVAEAMGLDYETIENIRYASPLHDVGKVAIPDAILLKPGKLTPEEFEVMKKHAVYGAEMLKGSSERIMQMAYNVALCHHERFDGTGYPRGVKGKDIPLEARIVAVVDVFDALTSKRVYKESWPVEEAVKYVRERSGADFDPDVVRIFETCLPHIQEIMAEDAPAGSPLSD